jgi:hypothetical protein
LKNLGLWQTIPQTVQINKAKELPIISCTTITRLIKLNRNIQLQFVNLEGAYETEIECASKTQFKINGMLYL